MIEGTNTLPKANLPPDLMCLNARQAAAALGIGQRTLWRFVSMGRLRAVRLSARCVRFRLSDLKTFLDENEGRR